MDLHAFGGGGQINNRRQDFVIDLDKLGRVTRLLKRFRDHRDDMIAYISHSSVGEDRMRRLVGR